MEGKHTESQVKEKFWAQQSVKNVMLTVSLDMKGPITIAFLKKGTTVNNASYYQLIHHIYLMTLVLRIYLSAMRRKF